MQWRSAKLIWCFQTVEIGPTVTRRNLLVEGRRTTTLDSWKQRFGLGFYVEARFLMEECFQPIVVASVGSKSRSLTPPEMRCRETILYRGDAEKDQSGYDEEPRLAQEVPTEMNRNPKILEYCPPFFPREILGGIEFYSLSIKITYVAHWLPGICCPLWKLPFLKAVGSVTVFHQMSRTGAVSGVYDFNCVLLLQRVMVWCSITLGIYSTSMQTCQSCVFLQVLRRTSKGSKNSTARSAGDIMENPCSFSIFTAIVVALGKRRPTAWPGFSPPFSASQSFPERNSISSEGWTAFTRDETCKYAPE